jgi:SAM-dependent methyltransferase
MVGEFELGGGIVPWGRSAREYEAFFDLAEVPRSTRVLDCGGGPSSFCAEWTRRGRPVVAADPVYACGATEIGAGFEQTAVQMVQGMKRAYARFLWTDYASPEAVVEQRRAALRSFLQDFGGGGAYVAAALPDLPFASNAFDLVLCSHLLFLYSEELSLAAHVAFLAEMLRVGHEVHVFPLRDMNGHMSDHVESCLREMEGTAAAEIVAVPYEFRVGDSSMLKLTRLS